MKLIPTVNSNSCNLVVGLAGDDDMVVTQMGLRREPGAIGIPGDKTF